MKGMTLKEQNKSKGVSVIEALVGLAMLVVVGGIFAGPWLTARKSHHSWGPDGPEAWCVTILTDTECEFAGKQFDTNRTVKLTVGSQPKFGVAAKGFDGTDKPRILSTPIAPASTGK